MVQQEVREPPRDHHPAAVQARRRRRRSASAPPPPTPTRRPRPRRPPPTPSAASRPPSTPTLRSPPYSYPVPATALLLVYACHLRRATSYGPIYTLRSQPFPTPLSHTTLVTRKKCRDRQAGGVPNSNADIDYCYTWGDGHVCFFCFSCRGLSSSTALCSDTVLLGPP